MGDEAEDGRDDWTLRVITSDWALVFVSVLNLAVLVFMAWQGFWMNLGVTAAGVVWPLGGIWLKRWIAANR